MSPRGALILQALKWRRSRRAPASFEAETLPVYKADRESSGCRRPRGEWLAKVTSSGERTGSRAMGANSGECPDTVASWVRADFQEARTALSRAHGGRDLPGPPRRPPRRSWLLRTGDQPQDEDGVQILAVAVDDGDPAAAGLLGQQLDDAGIAARVGVRQAAALRGVVFE